MATLGDVRSAIKDADWQRAAEALQVILDTEPSPDAWYLAARIADDKEKARKCLRRALLLDPNHRAARNMMWDIGRKPKSFWWHLGEEVADAFQEQGQKSILLRRFSPRTQLVAFSLMMLFLVLAIGLSLVNLVTPKGPIVAAAAPTPLPVPIISPGQVIQSLGDSDLELFALQHATDPYNKDKYSIKFGLFDTDGTWYLVNILVYRNIPALIEDRQLLARYEASANVIGLSNLVLIYPTEMDKEIAVPLVQAFTSIDTGPEPQPGRYSPQSEGVSG